VVRHQVLVLAFGGSNPSALANICYFHYLFLRYLMAQPIDPNQAMYDRIDAVLASNRRAEQVVIGMSIMIFLIGVALIIIGIVGKLPAVYVPSLIIEAFLYWPINKILKIRKENIALAAAPALIATLPPEQAAKEMVKLLEKVND
jgi:hypothetical protein